MNKIKRITIALLLIQLAACKDHLPIEGTPEHYALHGVVNDGKTINDIRVFHSSVTTSVHLRFPAGDWVGVTTQGWDYRPPVKIRKGYATLVFRYMAFDEKNGELVDLEKRGDMGVVGIHYQSSVYKWTPEVYGPESPTKLFERDIREWGLRESLRKRGERIEGRIRYFPIDKTFHAKNAEPIWMNCNVGGTIETTGEGPAGCFGYFQQRGLSVELYFDYRLMPRWREIYVGVSKNLDSIIIED